MHVSAVMRGNMEKKLGLKSYIGYGVADLGNNIAFAAVGSYLTVFYSDVLGAKFDEATAATWLTAVTAIMIIARIWDAINDPIMGWLAQRAKPSKYGKFRQYLLIGGIPLALSAVLMFAPIPDMSLAECIVFAFFTYIAYGMLYTVVLVPYGSLATVMTRNQNERSRLSIARSIGGGIGGVPAGILFPLLVYSTAYNAAGEEIKLLDGNKLVICMAVIAVIMLASYTIAFFFTKENFEYPPAAQQTKLTVALKSLVRNKPFVIMSLAGMLLIASSMYINSIDVYLFNVYYQKEGMMTFVTIATYAPMVVMIPFTEVVIKKVGKKEICVYGLILSVIATLVMTAWRIPNPWIFIAFCFLQGAGVSFFTLEIWALAMDVIDSHELCSEWWAMSRRRATADRARRRWTAFICSPPWCPSSCSRSCSCSCSFILSAKRRTPRCAKSSRRSAQNATERPLTKCSRSTSPRMTGASARTQPRPRKGRAEP